MILVITASRRAEEGPMHRALDVMAHKHGLPRLLIHGGARGGDTHAESWGRARGLRPIPIPAPWELYKRLGLPPKHAGHDRNVTMRDVALGCRLPDEPVYGLAMPAPDSIGTRDMIKLLRGADIPTWVVEVDP